MKPIGTVVLVLGLIACSSSDTTSPESSPVSSSEEAKEAVFVRVLGVLPSEITSTRDTTSTGAVELLRHRLDTFGVSPRTEPSEAVDVLRRRNSSHVLSS